MRRVFPLLLASVFVFGSPVVRATVFGTIRGIVHDPQHRPVAHASVALKSATSDWSASAETDDEGEFSFPAVSFGDYSVSISAPGLSPQKQALTLASETSSILHFQLSLAPVQETTVVKAEAGTSVMDTVTPTTLVDRTDIERTPGADLTNNLAMITDFTPGAYMTHDMLHVRGGHQTSWLIDGVAIPDTNIATSLAPRVSPRDIDDMEVLRGSYDATYGDRIYGMFNIRPKSGFDMNNEGELVLTAGSFWQTDDQLSFGGHSQRFAYYASLNGNRTNLGLETPIPQIYHDAANGFGGFTSLMYNLNPKDQIRFDGQWRRDFYQIPYDPNPNDSENEAWPTSGLRDTEQETDGYALFSWVHTFNSNTVLSVSPFYHYNSSGYHSPLTDTPVATTAVFTSNYGGGQADLSYVLPKNNLDLGIYAWGANQDELFNLVFNDGSGNPPIHEPDSVPGADIALFAEDKFNVTSWLSLLGGVRYTHFSSGITQNTTDPRIGGTLRIPHLNWVFRAFWGTYYQPPPLVTISGPLLSYLVTITTPENPVSFVALQGETDQEHQFGVAIPIHGWVLDMDYFMNRGLNFLDHNNIGESSIFIPVTFAQSRIIGREVTIRSPRLWKGGQFHLAYSNQTAQSMGALTGGLIIGLPPEPGWSALDHDQRNTLNVGFSANLPWQSFLSANVYYGSGFSNGSPNAQYPGTHLPGHAELDLSYTKEFREHFSVGVTALNVTDSHVLIDNSLTFGGFHYNNAFQIYGELRYRFHF